MFDFTTMQLKTRSSDGRYHLQEVVDEAERKAAAGDADAIAFIASLDLTAEFADADPRQVLHDQMRDCPECQAARARGEPQHPVEFSDVDINSYLAQLHAKPQRPAKPKRVRWRDQKRTRS